MSGLFPLAPWRSWRSSAQWLSPRRFDAHIAPAPAPRFAALSTGTLRLRLFLIWTILALTSLTISLSGEIIHSMGADDVMRLVQVRDLLNGQSWYDISQHRSNAVMGGAPMHWSRLVDAPLALIIFCLTPLVGQSYAEIAAMAIVPLTCLLLALLLTTRLALRLCGAQAASVTCLVLAITIPILLQLRAMRIDHHGWQIVLALVAANAMTAKDPRRGGYVLGAALALWLSISIEGLPMAAIFCAVMALRWLRSPGQREWFLATMQSLAITSLITFTLTRGWQDITPYCDTISPYHLTIFAFGAVATGLLARLNPLSPQALCMGFALMGAVALGIVMMAAPQCASGGFGEMDPLLVKYWLNNVLEGRPIWEQKLAFPAYRSIVLQAVIIPALGLIGTLLLIARSHGTVRHFWVDYAIMLAGAYIVSLFVFRAFSVSCTLALVPLGWLLWTLKDEKLRHMRAPKRMAAFALIIMLLLPAIPSGLYEMVKPPAATAAAAEDTSDEEEFCDMNGLQKTLGAPIRGEFFAAIDPSPTLLYKYPELTVVATAHHRGAEGMKQVITAFTSTPEEARAIIQARGSAYVALCPTLSEPYIYARNAPYGFAAQLLSGKTPDWLELVPPPPGKEQKKSAIMVWRVKG